MYRTIRCNEALQAYLGLMLNYWGQTDRAYSRVSTHMHTLMQENRATAEPKNCIKQEERREAAQCRRRGKDGNGRRDHEAALN